MEENYLLDFKKSLTELNEVIQGALKKEEEKLNKLLRDKDKIIEALKRTKK